MLLKTKTGRAIVMPTDAEDAAINAGIVADPDAYELEADWFAKAKPASEFFSKETFAALVVLKRPRGRPKADETKVLTAIRLDADLLHTFKSTGKGWQTRMNAALRQFIVDHPLGNK